MHDDTVDSAVFNAAGTRIVTASFDGTARLWDADGRPVGRIMTHDDGVYRAVFNASGTQIVTASYDGRAQLLDAPAEGLALMAQAFARLKRLALAQNSDCARYGIPCVAEPWTEQMSEQAELAKQRREAREEAR
jgi:hypothetical protein